MLLNRLKLNKDKTELLVISSLHLARPTLSHIHVCDESVLASSRASNIGILFDESLSMASLTCDQASLAMFFFVAGKSTTAITICVKGGKFLNSLFQALGQ